MKNVLRFAGCVAVFTSVFGAALTIGCATVPTDEESSSSEQDINGSLANAKACAVRDAFVRASVGDFATLVERELPFQWSAPSGSSNHSFARLDVRGVGAIYYVESTSKNDGGPSLMDGYFYDAAGRAVLRSVSSPTKTSFFNVNGTVLDTCGGSSSSSSGGWADAGSSSGGWGTDAGRPTDGGWGSSSSSGAITDGGFGRD